ncbi:MAG TPA: cellulase family glycosylhydrolase [Bacteroidia bacterium]|nr:cellulase family glycosylhydrolase [Bacteroidia bacterium]
MKKNKWLILVILIVFLVLIKWILNNDKKVIPNPNFVSLENGTFYLDHEKFYPVALNYMVSLQANDSTMWPSSFRAYGINSNFNYTTKDSSLMQLQAEMQMIKDLGFNTVRLVGIGEQNIENKRNGLLSVNAQIGNERDTTFYLASEKNYNLYFNALDELFDAAGKAGLKVIFLTRVFNEVKSTEKHLTRILDRFQNDSVIMAWDLFNEPLYFDSLERDKKQVYEISANWTRLVKKHAPHQLSTIGLTGIREVFEWDPNILSFDFLSIHPYEYEPDQVRNEMYWYAHYIKLPWIIGETSLPADGDSVPYSDQAAFAKKTLDRTYNCNGIGYSWWQYKDVEWFNFHSNFMGVMSHLGDTVNSLGQHIFGNVKPVAEVFQKYHPFPLKKNCDCLPNYYNYSENHDFRLTGKLTDNKGKPIEGGVILAWNKEWSHSYHTVTKKDGSFELLGNYPFYHWIASATLFSVVRGDCDPYNAFNRDGIPTFDLGELKIKKLDYMN